MRPDFLEHLFGGLDVRLPVVVSDVHHVEQQVGVAHHFQRRAERGHQLVRQAPDESHRVGKEELGFVVVVQHPGGGIQRGEQAIPRSQLGIR